MRRIHSLVPLRSVVALAACVGVFVGCGVDESSPDLATSGLVATTAGEDDRLSNPADTTVTEIVLETSFSYDPAADRAIAYFACRDQDGNSIWDFRKPGGTAGYDLNGRNFDVTLFPRVAPRSLDAEDFEVATSPVLTNKVIALVIDVSGSMSSDADPGDPGKGTRMDVAKQAAAAFVDVILDEVDDEDRIALVTFASDASIVSSLTNDAEQLKAMIDLLEPTSATNFGAGMAKAVKAVGIQPGKRAVVFLTDGADTVDGTSSPGVSGDWPTWSARSTSLRWQAMTDLLEYQLVAYTIGFGPAATGADADLRAFANDAAPTSDPPVGYPQGAFFPATTVEELNDAFDVTNPGGIPAGIEAMPGVSSPFVSFPNDYQDQAGPIEARVTLMFENGNGSLSASSLGTFIVP